MAGVSKDMLLVENVCYNKSILSQSALWSYDCHSVEVNLVILSFSDVTEFETMVSFYINLSIMQWHIFSMNALMQLKRYALI